MILLNKRGYSFTERSRSTTEFFCVWILWLKYQHFISLFEASCYFLKMRSSEGGPLKRRYRPFKLTYLGLYLESDPQQNCERNLSLINLRKSSRAISWVNVQLKSKYSEICGWLLNPNWHGWSPLRMGTKEISETLAFNSTLSTADCPERF
jgi:hypothetical protein